MRRVDAAPRFDEQRAARRTGDGKISGEAVSKQVRTPVPEPCARDEGRFALRPQGGVLVPALLLDLLCTGRRLLGGRDRSQST